jgi:hypothetical protein
MADITGTGDLIAPGASGDGEGTVGAAAFSLSTDAGSYAVTGSAAALSVAFPISATAGSYAVTGSAATFARGYVLQATPGSYAVTGAAASLRSARVVSGAAGSYAVTGTAATFSRRYALTGAAGAYDLAGLPANLLRTGQREIVLAPGTYTLTGADALALVTRVLSAAPGSYTLTGTDAAFDESDTPAEPGSYDLTGVDAVLVYTRLPYVTRTDATRRLRRTPPIHDEDRWIFHRSMQVDLEAGVGLVQGQGSNPQVMVRWSDDGGRTWSAEHWVSAGKLGQYQARAIWRNLGRSRDRVYEIVVTDPVSWNMIGASIDVVRGTH